MSMTAKMPTLTIRNVSPEVRDYFRKIAAQHGSSMEAEIRKTLAQTAKRNQTQPGKVARRIHERFAAIGGADDLPLPERTPLADPLTFEK